MIASAMSAPGITRPVGVAARGVAVVPNSARNCHAPMANRANSKAPRNWISDPKRVPDSTVPMPDVSPAAWATLVPNTVAE